MDYTFGPFERALGERYQFEQELGRGAMGTVYRARDVRLGRAVAIKMLHPALTNELGVGRFESEIRIAARLHHQNIISVHDSGEVEGRLFYVMDYFGGETLRDRLKREKQLSVEDAIHITEQVAAGLQHAHDHGVVHRDIKPENIILAEGQARIVDFGIAIALESVDEERLTATGLSVGTPHYISPEQAAAEREMGPQADQYALACVLFEMLAGEPPFTGPAASVVRRHITETPPLLRARRAKTPFAVEAAVARAMEKVPADRFPKVQSFASALSAIGSGRRLLGAASASVATLALLLWIAVSGDASLPGRVKDGVSVLRRGALDSTRIVVFPLRRSGTATVDGSWEDRLSDALMRWDPVTVPRQAELLATAPSASIPPATVAQALPIARAMRASRFVTSTARDDGGGVRISIELVDVAKPGSVRRASVLLPPNHDGADSTMAQLAIQLLFGEEAAMTYAHAAAGTKSLGAMQELILARNALESWNLSAAQSALTRSLAYDPSFAPASLTLAMVRFWSDDPSAEVTRLASEAMERGDGLSTSDVMHAAALRDLSEERYAAACARYDTLASRNARDFGAWYGLAECHRRDDYVVADTRSPSGRSYRASKYRGIIAINRAFDLLPRIDSCCVARSALVQRRFFPFASNTHVRYGRGVPPDSAVYVAYPELRDDTLAFVPYSTQFDSRPPPPTHTAAVAQQRRELLRLAHKRAAVTPGNADLLALLGEAMELRADPSAVDTIRRARALAGSAAQALPFAVNEVWLRLKTAVPDDARELALVRALAESLLASAPRETAGSRQLLASMAALLGSADEAARLSERIESSTAQFGLPPDVVGAGEAYVVAVAAGAESAQLGVREDRLVNAIANGLLQSQQTMARTMYLERGSVLAYPGYRASTFNQLRSGRLLLAAQAAHARGDPAAARRALNQSITARRGMRPADVTLDATLPEARLLVALGDTTGALQRISASLDALAQLPSRQFHDPVLAGCLMQAMTLRAELLAAQGNRVAAKRWAIVVAELTDMRSPQARQGRSRALAIAR